MAKTTDKDFVKDVLRTYLRPIVEDFQDTEAIVEYMAPRVIIGIQETADPDNWSSEDVRIALARLIKGKFTADK